MRNGGLAYVVLYAESLEEARRFYVELLGLEAKQVEEWGLIVSAGAVELTIHPQGDRPPQHAELVFAVDDLDAAFAELRAAGVRVLEEPAEREWGDRDGAVADPDGNRIYLREAT